MTTPEALAALLPEWMVSQRWFAGKDWPIVGIRVLAHARAEGPVPIDHLVVGVEQDVPGRGRVSTPYQVALSTHSEPEPRLAHVLVGTIDGGYVYDGLHDRNATGLILDRFRVQEQSTPLKYHLVEGATVPETGDSLVLTGEQSNTSLAFGDQALLKVYRRLTPGTNPDVEVLEALAHTDCPHVAPLYGWIDGYWDDPVTGERTLSNVAMLQEFLTTATDGFKLAMSSVADLFAERDLHADEVGGDFAGESYRLGRATSCIHRAMRAVLPTAVWTDEQRRAAASAMLERMEQAAAEVPLLTDLVPGLRSAFTALAEFDEPVAVQRVHGDLHLGQALRTALTWKIIDFEGEPEKPLAERRSLDSPLRDVAGMLRSFDYAALNTLLGEHADDTQLAYRAAEWAERNRRSYLDGYASDADIDLEDQEVVLRAYETDKAVYELVYEARNRPTWTAIPMTALERLAQ